MKKRKNILERKENEAKGEYEEKVIDAIIADAKMELPEAMVDTQQRQMIEEFAQRIQSQGLSMEQYMQFTGLTVDKLLEQVKPQAEKRIKSRLVLEAVVKAEAIEVTEEDFEAEVTKMAEAYKLENDKVKELLGEAGKKQVMEDLAVSKEGVEPFWEREGAS